MQSLNKLTIKDLDLNLKKIKNSENIAIADVVLYLSEIHERKAFRDLGYSSLFTYCREALGYSEGAAYARTEVAKCLRANPEIYNKIKSGKLTLCAALEISKVKSEAGKQELIQSSEGKSKREVQAMTAKFLPPQAIKKESIKVKSVKTEGLELFSKKVATEETKASVLHYNFSIEVNEEFMSLYKEAKEIIGHVPASEVFRRCIKHFVDSKTTLKRRVSSEVKNSRFIPKAVKLEVVKRDEKQCCFVSESGIRCSEKHGLQFDHVMPFALGGNNDSSNIRLLCKAHNLLQAEVTFGKRACG